MATPSHPVNHHFNPRSPHGERRRGLPKRRTGRNFNPRSPHGERRDKLADRSHSIVFQSTLPARGATEIDYWAERIEIISIHAPRTGSDGNVRSACPR